ncbi:hypothetical protein ACLF3G_13500 [Falsiroseomonas sp. HC035]|uniref:hypothetical protein n=1 Tax=Falsiroseomonas sp. HC035 TaxID=3390999 RepID=UPI003D31B7DA
MSDLATDILGWSDKLRSWQQDALRRLAAAAPEEVAFRRNSLRYQHWGSMLLVAAVLCIAVAAGDSFATLRRECRAEW